MGKFLKVVGGFFVGMSALILAIGVIGAMVGKNDRTDTSGPGAAVAAPSVPRPPSAGERMQALMGGEQKKFVSIIEAARQVYASGPNDMAKGAARPARGQAICSMLPSRTVEWVGRVAKLSTNGEGKGVLQIEIGPRMSVKTWNNALSDAGSNTLIEPSSALFWTASQLRVGQLVRFNGAMFPDKTDCVSEGSMSLAGSIREPEFIIRFRSITPVE